jgi:hypothetical protein
MDSDRLKTLLSKASVREIQGFYPDIKMKDGESKVAYIDRVVLAEQGDQPDDDDEGGIPKEIMKQFTDAFSLSREERKCINESQFTIDEESTEAYINEFIIPLRKRRKVDESISTATKTAAAASSGSTDPKKPKTTTGRAAYADNDPTTWTMDIVKNVGWNISAEKALSESFEDIASKYEFEKDRWIHHLVRIIGPKCPQIGSAWRDDWESIAMDAIHRLKALKHGSMSGKAGFDAAEEEFYQGKSQEDMAEDARIRQRAKALGANNTSTPTKAPWKKKTFDKSKNWKKTGDKKNE